MQFHETTHTCRKSTTAIDARGTTSIGASFIFTLISMNENNFLRDIYLYWEMMTYFLNSEVLWMSCIIFQSYNLLHFDVVCNEKSPKTFYI